MPIISGIPDWLVRAAYRLNPTIDLDVDILGVFSADGASTKEEWEEGVLTHTESDLFGAVRLQRNGSVVVFETAEDVSDATEQRTFSFESPETVWLDFWPDPSVIGEQGFILHSVETKWDYSPGSFSGNFPVVQVGVSQIDNNWNREQLTDPIVITDDMWDGLTAAGTAPLVINFIDDYARLIRIRCGRQITRTGTGRDVSGLERNVDVTVENGKKVSHLDTFLGFSIQLFPMFFPGMDGGPPDSGHIWLNAHPDNPTTPVFDVTKYWRTTEPEAHSMGPYSPDVDGGASPLDIHQYPGYGFAETGAAPGSIGGEQYGAIDTAAQDALSRPYGLWGISGQVPIKNHGHTGDQSLNQPYHKIRAVKFWDTGTVVRVFDLGHDPKYEVHFRADSAEPVGTSVTFSIQGSDDNVTFSGAWAAEDGDVWTEGSGHWYRYYKVTATLTGPDNLFDTPVLNAIFITERVRYNVWKYLRDFDCHTVVDPTTGQSSIGELSLSLLRLGRGEARDIITKIATEYPMANIEAWVYIKDVIRGQRYFNNLFRLENRQPTLGEETMTFVSGMDRLKVVVPKLEDAGLYPSNNTNAVIATVSYDSSTRILRIGVSGTPFQEMGVEGWRFIGKSGVLNGLDFYIVTQPPPTNNEFYIILENDSQVPAVGDQFILRSGEVQRALVDYYGKDFSHAYKDVIQNQAQLPQRYRGIMPPTTGRSAYGRLPADGVQALDVLQDIALHCDGAFAWRKGRVDFINIYGPKTSVETWSENDYANLDMNMGADRRMVSINSKYDFDFIQGEFIHAAVFEDADALLGMGRANLFDIIELDDDLCQWNDLSEAKDLAEKLLKAWSTGVRIWHVSLPIPRPWREIGEAVTISTDQYTDRILKFTNNGLTDEGTPVKGRLSQIGVIVGKNIWGTEFDVAVLEVTQRLPSLPEALVSVSQLAYEGYENGMAQIQARYNQLGTDPDPAEHFEWVATGGREGGGYIRSTTSSNAFLRLYAPGDAADNGGVPEPLRVYLGGGISDVGGLPRWGGQHHAFNLFGEEITTPIAIMQFGRVLIEVTEDRRIRASLLGSLGSRTPISPDSEEQVPADGWWAIEAQVGLAPEGANLGGFILVQLYYEDGPYEGTEVVREIGTTTSDFSIPWVEFINPFQWGTDQQIGMGIDDSVIYGPWGEIKRFLGKTYVMTMWPSAEPSALDDPIGYTEGTSQRTVTAPSSGDFSVGNLFNIGLAIPGGRYKTAAYTDHDISEIMSDGHIGWGISQFTGDLLFNTPYSGPILGWPRIKLAPVEGNELYPVAVPETRGSVLTIEGVQPFLLVGFAFVHEGGTSQGFVDFPAGPDFDYFGAANGSVMRDNGNAAYDDPDGSHPQHDDPYVNSPSRHIASPMIRSGEEDVILHPIFGYGDPLEYPGSWHSYKGYTVTPSRVVEKDPSTTSRWEPSAVESVKVGANQSLDIFLTNNPGAVRGGDEVWVSTDLGQVGLEVAYHKESVAEITTNPNPSAPSMDVVEGLSHHPELGILNLYDNSVDFNDGPAHLFDHITSRIVNWGDGTPEEDFLDFGGPGPDGIIHSVEAWGEITVTVTDTNIYGISNSWSKVYTIENRAPSANFEYDTNPSDMSGLTIDFTDLSTDPENAIESWAWDFGDAGTSTVQNPTHAFAAPGDYDVELEIVDDGGLTDTITVTITVPIPAPSLDCDLSAVALANTAWVQAEDYNGGDPPKPAYAATSSFEDWYGATNGAGGGYGGSTFRHCYEFTNGNSGLDDVDYFIDTTVLFNGHNTLKQLFGHDTVTHFGAYHYSDLTDDGSPTETYPPNAALNQPSINGSSNFPNSFWARVIFKGDAGLMQSATTTWGQGLEIFGFSASGNMYIINRQGKIKLDTRTRQTSPTGAFTNVSTDICNEDVFFGRADSLFGELIVYYEGNEVTNQLNVKVWVGDQCTLGGTSPTVNYTVAAFGFLDVSAIEMWNVLYSGLSGHTTKALWVALWEHVPGAISANPYGVSLV